ncbi:MAG: type II secretion system protein GspN [SAR324 cluster bacterium]|nr:type II secretion system protein GspN [SAR324 cluster bacterium]
MRLLKRFVLLLTGSAMILGLVFWGFKQNFPGKTIADAARIRLTAQTGIPFEIQDLELGWNKISTPEIALRTPKWLTGFPDLRLLVLENIEAPFASIITSGKVKMLGQVHEGAIKVSTDLLTQKMLDFSINGLQYERVPLFSLVPYAFVSGVLSLTAHIENFYDLQKQARFPEGSLKGKLNDAHIRISGGTALMDLQLPELDLSEVYFNLQLGPLIHIKKIELQGSLAGTIDGTIQLNDKRPQMSLIDLNMQLTPSPSLKKELSTYSTMLRTFQCGETIKINLKGSFNRLNFPTRNKC